MCLLPRAATHIETILENPFVHFVVHKAVIMFSYRQVPRKIACTYACLLFCVSVVLYGDEHSIRALADKSSQQKEGWF